MFAEWHKTGPKRPYKEPTDPKPTDEQLEEWILEGVCEATDGCTVEPDGYCEHFHVSWLLYFDMI